MASNRACVAQIFVYILLGMLAFVAVAAALWYAVYTPIKLEQRAKQLAELGPLLLLSRHSVDLQKYAGEWHEVARLPNSFQRTCLRSKATYSASASRFDRLIVVNECETDKATTKRVVGRATPINAANTALAVAFAPRWLGPAVAGDYWILDLDADYRHAVIGSPDRKYLWFLAREPTIEQSEFARMSRVAQGKGYDTSKLVLPTKSVE